MDKIPPRQRRVSCCSECRRAIQASHTVVWQRKGATGLVHIECASDPEAQPVDVAVVTQRFVDL